MPRLSAEKINEIRQSVDIVDVIGNYLSLQKKGRNYVSLCPFHDDSHPSMSISPERQIYMCFVCHNGGNVFTFLKNYLKIPYIEAVKMVASMGNIDISEYNLEKRVQPVEQKFEPLYKMHDEANKIYNHYLNTKLAIDAKEYLTKRKITDEIIDMFEIGYAPSNNILLKAFEKMNFNKVSMYESGLVIESNAGYDRFSNRIMFPLHDANGRVVGFSGRIYQPSQNESKYMNSPESDIFIKGETLYNYHRVIEETRQAGFVIITEGFMDVIALYKAGIKNAVAIMGTALTKGHVSLLKRLSKTVYLCLDGDKAGKNATIKSIDILLHEGFTIKVVDLPENLDPDEFLDKKGGDELESLIKSPLSSLDFKMNYYYEMTNMDNYDDRKKYLETIAKEISNLSDIIDQDYYIQQLEKKSGFSKETITRLVSDKNVSKIEQVNPSNYIPYQKSIRLIDKYVRAERDLLYYMMNDKNVAMMYEAKAGFMFNDTYRIIASYIVDYYRQEVVLEVADLISSIEDENLVKNIVEISQLELPELQDSKAIEDYIEIIKEKTVRIKVEELTKALKDTFDPKQKAQILKEIIALKDKE
ncbi:DNA primase [Thomasclavelia cocleata]|uniref:DNA primase n=2 Tax=Thomasclavelia cocleata TaxID=69824 RepID=A0A1I0DHQ6_9FIRM|nr:DNA primase [Thomasclavelia cocleata]MCI9131083.1 DNA primase [Thomasclavelia cocleata]MCR1961121.1 DNA primase [Thomasclavelia cocleata]NDO42643.1 DNA primase [Thomasclavelia cocleata]PJN80433.1 DNA primase [Thomasclavelia cocleata]SET31613.1 DNA primase [Thomasclavelia cocleata]